SDYHAFKCIKFLLEKGADIMIDDINERTLIHKFGGSLPSHFHNIYEEIFPSVNVDDSTVLEFILENLNHSETSKVSTPDVFGRHPLHYAAANGLERVTYTLLEHLISNDLISVQTGFNDPFWWDSYGYTPLLYAVSHGHTKIVDFIVRRLKNFDMISIPSIINFHNDHIQPLILACKLGHYEMAKLLLSHGADPNVQNEEGETSLHISAKNGFLDCVMLLVGLDNDPSPWKANTEIKDKIYGWTPLFGAVNTLLQVGAKKNLLDFFEFTPFMHAIFRGHGFKDLLKPTLHELEPLDSKLKIIGFNKEKYLQENQSLILVMLGTNDTRKSVIPIQLNIPMQLTSLVVRVNNADAGEPVIIDLPLKENSIIEPCIFYISNVNSMRTDEEGEDNLITLIFDLIPTFGIKKKLIGRATALLSSELYHTSLTSSVSVPIIGTDVTVLGRIVFEFLIVKPYKPFKPFQNQNLNEPKSFWTSLTTKIIGHRGMGESPFNENTLMSFLTAASLGAEYVEMDVQLTKDHVAVVYHDWTCSETGYDIPINSITLEQFQKIKRSNSENKQTKDGIWKGTIQAPFTTLEETFKKLPLSIGFIIEIKYPMVDEAQDFGLPTFYTELNMFIDSILNCVFCHAGERDIIFSSFSPDICLMLSWKQRSFPVFFLTDCGVVRLADARCNSIQQAVRFAQFARLLGIVTNVEPIIEAPGLVKIIKDSRLLLFTYGPLNNSFSNVQLQRRAGVDAVIVDSVLIARGGMTI
ncbi:11236_t:CDS:2, partial [Diversispora eburnea]